MLRKNCVYFISINLLGLIQCSFIRSFLDYCSIIWSPYLQKYISTLEGNRNKFLGFLCYRCCIPLTPQTSYDPSSNIHFFDSLKLRQIKLCFLCNIKYVFSANCFKVQCKTCASQKHSKTKKNVMNIVKINQHNLTVGYKINIITNLQ